MSNTRPFTEAHAIASVDLALLMKEAPTAEQRSALTSALGDYLNKFDFHPDESRDGAVTAFQRTSGEEGDVAEEVHIHDDFVHAVSLDYRGWTLTKQSLLERLAPALEMTRSGQLPMIAVGLMIRDVFVNADPKTYDPTEVFKPGCRYLPASAFENGRKWRYSFSWRDEIGVPGQARSLLTVDARVVTDDDDGEETHFTEITHSQQFAVNDVSDQKVSWSNESIHDLLDRAHRRNKEVLADLLTSEMIERIGLTEESV